ncbi:MAG: lysoplasmalogenase family protein [Pseudomonadota bacterium]|uniref:lysoplasmalogenase family protein n=1 Tax=Phenylobacterium sp. TaxID=1871053 RepID=UPI0025E7192A|nr:lysoplasmalogenase family protein [Phenylobacterium sp.]MBT9472329.1 lysoplasmalogenase [Phenylobacterium sp.]
MDRRNLAPLLVLAGALIASVSYVASWDMAIPDTASMLWKGAGVTLLALYAGMLARNLDGWLICAVMAFGALGDMLLEAAGLTVGAVAFLIGHLIAIWLYLRNRRPVLTRSQLLLAICLVPATGVLTFLLPTDRGLALAATLYSMSLAIMAAMAWTSRFPRALVGAGALMFVVSDLLIFARAGPLVDAAWIGLAIWGLYFAGQTLICLGVTRTLARNPLG